MGLVLDLYHQAPAPLKSLVASARGYTLRHWRYGAQTEQLVAEAFERETWDAGQWRTWQEERLARLLHRAATRVPYYREAWSARRRAGDRASWDILANWPLLDKEPLRANPKLFVANDCNPGRMYHIHTSGSTGKSVDLWWSRTTCREWYALFEARWRRWNGVNLGSRWAMLGGQLVVPQAQRKPPFWVWNQAFNQLYMSAYHLAPGLLPAYLDALRKYRIEYLWGYSSALYSLAQSVLREGRNDLRMAVVIANAEPLWEHQRAVIAEAFQCPVRETYGMAEIVAGASECNEGQLHFWPESGMFEVFKEGRPVAVNEAGDLICTGLMNQDMPLIRYRVGDRGFPLQWEHACPCGRTLPLLPGIEGRADDVLLTPDGREVGRLDPVFKGGMPVREAQIIQEDIDRIRVKVVPADNFCSRDVASLQERIRQRMGDVVVIVEEVDEIPRTRTGKFKAVVSLLKDADRSQP